VRNWLVYKCGSLVIESYGIVAITIGNSAINA